MSAPFGTTLLTPFDSLLSEANLGLACLEDARRLQQADRRWRCLQNARRALETVRSKKQELPLAAAQAEALDRVEAELQQGLEAL